jgi:hypothetical protein
MGEVRRAARGVLKFAELASAIERLLDLEIRLLLIEVGVGLPGITKSLLLAPLGNQMKVGVEDRLPGKRARVVKQIVVLKTLSVSYHARDHGDITEILGLHFMQSRRVMFWKDYDVASGLRLSRVHDRDGSVALKHFLCLYFPLRDQA